MHYRRKRVIPVCVAVAITSCVPIFAGATDTASALVTRAGPGIYELHWSRMGGTVPVDVYVAEQPDAPPDARRQVIDDDLDGAATVRLESRQRLYFYIAPEGGRGLWTAERVLPLQGGRNFRDLGGYQTNDGRHVRWGKVFRSGTMSGLTDTDYDYLSHLGIRVICDFRTVAERKAYPNKWGVPPTSRIGRMMRRRALE